MDHLFHPRSVAIVGASADETRFAGRPLQILARQGFAGRVVAVNPRWTSIGEHACFPTLRDVPHPVDVALVCTPATSVPAVLEDCVAAGIPNAIVIASGFEETQDGHGLARQVRSIATEHALNVVGPNSEGLWSIPDRALMTFGSAALRENLINGPVSILSQSGSIGGALVRLLQDAGIGCRYFVSVGNETVLSTADYLDYIVKEGESPVIALFIEAISDPRTIGLLDEARQRGVQIVALRAGSSERGRAATATHSGRMASGAQIYQDVLRQLGVIEVDSLQSLASCCDVVATFPPQGSGHMEGVAVIAVSGGSRALIVDECARHDVPLATFDPGTIRRLQDTLPDFGSADNPIDVTGSFLTDPELFDAVTSAVAHDSKTGSVLLQLANGGRAQLEEQEARFRDLPNRLGKPVVIGLLGDLPDEDVVRRLRSAGLHLAPDPVVAVRRMAWVYRRDSATRATVDHASAARIPGFPDGVSDADVDALLDHLGAPGPRSVLVDRTDNPRERSTDLRPPYVAKSPHGHIAHRSEAGLVRLDLRDDSMLVVAVEDLRPTLGETPVLVQEQVIGLEVLLAVLEDPDLGPVLVIGSGGVRTEILDDVAYVPLPTTASELADALARTRLYRRLVPWRNDSGVDVTALITAAERLGQVFLQQRPKLQAIELNPVVVTNHGCTTLDVLLTRGDVT